MFFDEIGDIASLSQFGVFPDCVGMRRDVGQRSDTKLVIYYGEFDPGSGRTLAAGLTHASRTSSPDLVGGASGERVRNT